MDAYEMDRRLGKVYEVLDALDVKSPPCTVCGAKASEPCKGPPPGRRCPWAVR